MSNSISPFLSSSPSPITSAIHLALSVSALIISLLLVVTESRLNPRHPRLLLSGEALSLSESTPSDPQQQQQQQQQPQENPQKRKKIPTKSRTPLRAKVCIAVLRLLLALSLAANLALAALSLIRVISKPPISTLASQETNQFAHSLLTKALVKYATDTPDAEIYADSSVSIGVSERLLTPEKEGGVRVLYVILLVVIPLISVIGLLLAVLPEKLSVQRAVAAIFFAQAVVWLVGSLIATLVWPTKLPYDATPIVNHWMDRVYVDDTDWINETRIVGNWFIKVDQKIQPVTALEGFESSFCTVFTQLIPETGAEVVQEPPPIAPVTLAESAVSALHGTTNGTDLLDDLEDIRDRLMSTTTKTTATTEKISTDDETFTPNIKINDAGAMTTLSSTTAVAEMAKQSTESTPTGSLSKENAEQFLMAYLIGRPSGINDAFRVLSYVALGAMAGAPAVVGQLCKLWILTPLVLIWAALWLSFMLLGTPSVLRALAMPIEGVQEFIICDIKYRVLVVDRMTRMVAGLDAAFFSIVLLVGLVNGFRWLRFAEMKLKSKEGEEGRPVSYEEVYSTGGALRW